MAVMLDKNGLIASALMGILILFSGGWEYLMLLLAFLGISVIATSYEGEEKKQLGIYEYERSWENVLSNGLLPTLLAFAGAFLGPMPFIASVAAITSDKFASELGVLEKKKPIYLLGLKEVPPGTSGAVSPLGTFMSFAGALFIGVAAILIFGISPTSALLVGVVGFLGNVADTIAGVFEEKGIGNKYTSNFICSLTGALLGMYLKF
ncbi:MAG: DUF92 domain-containing protein [Candidatus ainarchaeum sp.]|nr:DUF92 domain-containing protein [Candidatus ainarchaeum sp.]